MAIVPKVPLAAPDSQGLTLIGKLTIYASGGRKVMAVDLKQKLGAFRVKAPKSPAGDAAVVLPQAFLAKTLVKCSGIPANVDVLVERDYAGDFALTWYDGSDRPVYHKAAKDSGSIDISDIHAGAVASLLEQLTTEDLQREIDRRALAAEVETAKS